MADRGLPASVGPVGTGSVDRGTEGGAGAAEDDGPDAGVGPDPGESPRHLLVAPQDVERRNCWRMHCRLSHAESR